MSDLIKALTIFQKYKDLQWPTHCEHDVLYIMGVTQDEVSDDDKRELESLGFIWGGSDDCWLSFRYGSA